MLLDQRNLGDLEFKPFAILTRRSQRRLHGFCRSSRAS